MDMISEARAYMEQASAEDFGTGDSRADRLIAAAQACALIAIAEQIVHPAVTPDASTEVGRYVHPTYSAEEARWLAMPEPKGYTCPACGHTVSMHRIHGCDCGGCDCPAPFGRIAPADPDPS